LDNFDRIDPQTLTPNPKVYVMGHRWLWVCFLKQLPRKEATSKKGKNSTDFWKLTIKLFIKWTANFHTEKKCTLISSVEKCSNGKKILSALFSHSTKNTKMTTIQWQTDPYMLSQLGRIYIQRGIPWLENLVKQKSHYVGKWLCTSISGRNSSYRHPCHKGKTM